MKNLKQYIIALTNLYGIVSKEKVAEIYNMQNDDNITIEDINECISLKKDELEEEFVLLDGDYFVHESLYVFDDDLVNDMLEIKGDKPYYIPKKKELLKYADEWYFEKNKQYFDLYNYLKKDLVKDEEELEEICEDIQGMLHVDAKIGSVLNIFNNKNIVFDSEEQLEKVAELIIEFSNNMRLWENNGYTPKELFEKFEKSNLGSTTNKPIVIKKKKIGRNDPCPCGSGKKYKKCCIDKQ